MHAHLTAPPVICTCCGHNMAAEVPITAGRFSYSAGRGFMLDGERMKMTPACHLMLGSIMAANGAVVRTSALVNRQFEDAANPGNLVSVYVYWLRKAFGQAGVPVPFVRVRGVGLRWSGPLEV